MIGFDMDYTLALYHQDKLEQLSIELTLGKLIEKHGYPEAIRELHYDPRWAIRGLMVDRQLGNVFKMDRHSHVGRCYHGFRELDHDERKATYRNEKINLSSDRCEWIDTLFGLPEAVMYTTLVDWADQPDRHRRLRQAVRRHPHRDRRGAPRRHAEERDQGGPAVVHRQGPAARRDAAQVPQLGQEAVPADQLALRLHRRVVMSYLLDGERKAYPSWRNYFDIVIVGGAKPAFFNELRPFVQIDPATGAPIDERRDQAPVARQGLPGRQRRRVRADDRHQAASRCSTSATTSTATSCGCASSTCGAPRWCCRSSSARSRSAIGSRRRSSDLELLDRRHRNLESEIDYQTLRLKKIQRLLDDETTSPPLRARLEEERKHARASVDSLRDRAGLMDTEVDSLEARIDRAYNSHWGSCLREGNENSRFGEQVNDYADLYTSRVSNFGPYSPLRYFRAPRRPMPHEV